MNRVCLLGRITADPELKQTTSGISACSFTLAVDRGFKDAKGERQTDFISCIAWRQTAEFISRYFSKGKMIIVEGASFSSPVLVNGKEDYAKSRRVELKIVMKGSSQKFQR